MKRKAQVTIWIIVAVLIAASILIFFAIKERQGTEISQPSTADPQAYIEKCLIRGNKHNAASSWLYFT